MEKKLIYYAVEHLGESFDDPVSNGIILIFLPRFHKVSCQNSLQKGSDTDEKDPHVLMSFCCSRTKVSWKLLQ